jgi:hypothetical protein
MRIKIYTEYGALNSKPVFESLKKGFKAAGHSIVDSGEDIAVIWSVLWLGRMKGNQRVYELCKKRNIPVLIAEVGNLKRNQTWRLSIGNINGQGYFGNDIDLDPQRPQRLKVYLEQEKSNRKNPILIACQHHHSLQWEGQPSIQTWVSEIVKRLRERTQRPIIVRPHPRNIFSLNLPGVHLQNPNKLNNTYDDFDIDYDYHCVINHNSGPAVQAAIKGVPVVCDQSSLAFPISDSIENIENIKLVDRTEWFLRLCHTEWTLEEIETGEPIKRLIK